MTPDHPPFLQPLQGLQRMDALNTQPAAPC